MDQIQASVLTDRRSANCPRKRWAGFFYCTGSYSFLSIRDPLHPQTAQTDECFDDLRQVLQPIHVNLGRVDGYRT